MPLGIPHSVFVGWDADDRGKALAWQARKSRTCPQCGTRAEEWDPRRGGDRHAYVGAVKHCQGCQQLQTVQKNLADDGDRMRGDYVTLVPKKEASRGATHD